jgi:hypothetical protein
VCGLCLPAQVDLYSLGVVVFEMWHPFSTAMERAVLLRELREAGKLPPAWEAAHPQVARLIRCVLEHRVESKHSQDHTARTHSGLFLTG